MTGGDGGSTPAEPPAPAREPVLAADSAPAGLKPLSDAERDQLKGPCAKLVQWAQKRAGKAPTRAAATQKLLEALSGAPKIEGVDVDSCRGLLTRDLKVYVARTKEIEAVTTLKMLMLAMASAVDQRGKLCPSAPPVPSQLAAVKTGPYQPQDSDWQAEGWRCLRHQGRQPQRFQYEVKSDPAADTFEIVARGYPVAGSEPTELFLTHKVVNGKVELHSNVYRR
ncbi:MAG: hypothetical protein JRI68_30865 [Deltaproteobacteria bacterium]|nr:hypothetical protein [Deltaproteobacteria bacterium]